jgi:hypothetical protein
MTIPGKEQFEKTMTEDGTWDKNNEQTQRGRKERPRERRVGMETRQKRTIQTRTRQQKAPNEINQATDRY